MLFSGRPLSTNPAARAGRSCGGRQTIWTYACIRSTVTYKTAQEGKENPLTNVTFLKGLAIQATDGKLGTVDQFYFDDETWAIRYLTVETDGWLGGRQVLISPFAILHTDLAGQAIGRGADEKAGSEQPRHQHTSASLPAARGRI